MNYRGRAYRRHQERRAKHRAYVFLKFCCFGGPNLLSTRMVGLYASTHCKPCSCARCGNARPYEGPTRQERNAQKTLEEEAVDLYGRP